EGEETLPLTDVSGARNSSSKKEANTTVESPEGDWDYQLQQLFGDDLKDLEVIDQDPEIINPEIAHGIGTIQEAQVEGDADTTKVQEPLETPDMKMFGNYDSLLPESPDDSEDEE